MTTTPGTYTAATWTQVMVGELTKTHRSLQQCRPSRLQGVVCIYTWTSYTLEQHLRSQRRASGKDESQSVRTRPESMIWDHGLALRHASQLSEISLQPGAPVFC